MTELADLYDYSLRIRGLLRDLRAQLAGDRCHWRGISAQTRQDWEDMHFEMHRLISANFWLRDEIERRQAARDTTTTTPENDQ